jgi:hypothetical protein
LADKHHRPDPIGAFGDFPLRVSANQTETTHGCGNRRDRQLVAKELDSNVRIGNVVENPLPEHVLTKRTRISMKCRLGFSGAVKMMPSLRRHGPARDLTKIAETHLFKWFFNHKLSL